MKQIELTTGGTAYVSDEDYKYLTRAKWVDDGHGYAKITNQRGLLHEYLMHRVVAKRLGLKIKGKHVHHKDGNPLNNTRENLESLGASEHRIKHALPVVSDDILLELLDEGMRQRLPQVRLAEMCGITNTQMGRIIKGNNRKQLTSRIQALILKHGWRRWKQSFTDDEILASITAYRQSGLSLAKWAAHDGRMSREHWRDIISGKKLPHLQPAIQQLLNQHSR